jgi:hypothetical protein
MIMRSRTQSTNNDLTGRSCQNVSTSSSYRTCWVYLSARTVDALAFGSTVSATLFGICGQAAEVVGGWAVVCNLLVALVGILVASASYIAAIRGASAWLYIYQWRLVWQYPAFGWYGFYWAWGHSPWFDYYAYIG